MKKKTKKTKNKFTFTLNRIHYLAIGTLILGLLSFTLRSVKAENKFATDEMSLFDAVNSAQPGDVIVIVNNFTLSHQVDLRTPGITIDGGGNTISSFYTSTEEDNSATFGIYADNIVIKNLIIKPLNIGYDKNLHGIQVVSAGNILIENVSFLENEQSGLLIKSSAVNATNITTMNNGVSGIYLAQLEGSATPTVLNISGTNYHNEAAAIWVPDFTNPLITVNYNPSQYDYLDGIYTLAKKDPKGDCTDGRWATWTDPYFKNQGDCIKWVQQNIN